MAKLIISILVCCAFPLRDAICHIYYPEMRTVTGEWDGANTLTMNFFAGIIFGLVIIQFLKTTQPLTNLFLYVTFGFCLNDVVCRITRNYGMDGFDIVFVTPIVLIISTLYYGWRFREKNTN